MTEEKVIIEGTEEPKRVQKVVQTTVVQRKKGLTERVVLALIGPDGLPAVGRYLNKEIVMPALKNIFVDSLTSGLNMMVFGKDATPRNTGTGTNYYYGGGTTNYPKTNYHSNYTNPGPTSGPVPRIVNGMVQDFEIATRPEAASVINMLTDTLARYGAVTVADYYDSIGVESSFTDNNYGWRDLRQATIVPSGRGFVVKLPPVTSLK